MYSYVLYRNRNYKINKKSAVHGTNILLLSIYVKDKYVTRARETLPLNPQLYNNNKAWANRTMSNVWSC